jgi:hypothetical protein
VFVETVGAVGMRKFCFGMFHHIGFYLVPGTLIVRHFFKEDKQKKASLRRGEE